MSPAATALQLRGIAGAKRQHSLQSTRFSLTLIRSFIVSYFHTSISVFTLLVHHIGMVLDTHTIAPTACDLGQRGVDNMTTIVEVLALTFNLEAKKRHFARRLWKANEDQRRKKNGRRFQRRLSAQSRRRPNADGGQLHVFRGNVDCRGPSRPRTCHHKLVFATSEQLRSFRIY